jgi:Ca2+-binding RTX toxin-like protein
MVQFIRSDLEFILKQIQIAEQLTDLTAPDGTLASSDILSVLPNDQVPWGLRTVDGTYNNLVFSENLGIDQTQFGAADTVFPRLLTPTFRTADSVPADFFGPGSPAMTTSYAQTSGTVVDAQPRIISNLIVDQTANNPAAVAAAAATPGAHLVTSPGLDGIFGTADDHLVNFIPNVAPDAGLSAPFNAWFTFFGQFFDHGLDLVTKGGQDVVFIPLQPDDPLFVPGSHTNFMVETRATNVAVHPGPDGLLGTADDIHDNQNTTTPFVDQNQTYTSHPSHQVFLRAYQLLSVDPDGAGPATAHLAPFATGKLITNRDIGADGHFGTGDDVEIGGMSTWGVVKAQARDVLGINLTDANVFNAPLLATDAYGNFIPGAHGFPQVVLQAAFVGDPILDPDGDGLMEGNPAAPVDLTHAVGTGHQFLIDIAHAADPSSAPGLVRDDNGVIGGPQAPGTYDGELLDAHYIAGDGRANENIGLTAVHAIFHSEHNRLVDQTKQVLITDALQHGDVTFLNDWLLSPTTLTEVGTHPENLVWNGERLFQAGRFGTEMQYQHLVFEEFARTVQPDVDEFLAPDGYDTTINPAIVAEFAHTVYRFGHTMLTETVDRFDPDFNVIGTEANPDQQIGLIAAFLNPLAFVASGPTPEEAVGALARGLTREVGNQIDEFVTEALRNNLVGLPLDLAVLNLARGRDTGIPGLNEARREFYSMTNNNNVGDSNLKPYISWVDFMGHLRHPESLINFIAAYGTHAALTAADVDTLAEKRAVAAALVLGGSAVINAGTAAERTFIADDIDRLDFLNSTGIYHNILAGPDGQLGTADDINDINGVTTTGVDLIDFWVGGLAEANTPFGGMLGSTFNFVFENQLEALQNGDRFYYLSRTAGLNFGTELENTKFSQLVMLNSDATHLPADIFSTPTWILEVDPSKQFTGLGPDGRADPGIADDPTGGITINGIEIAPVVIRDNPATSGPDSNYLQYTGENHIVLGGTNPGNVANPSGNDILISGIGDDTVYGDGGNDRIEGGAGDDQLFGGAGDDIITDVGGIDVIHGDAGNDVISDSHSFAGAELANILLGGDGKDFIVTWDDINIVFGGAGDDFIYGSKPNLPETGNEGDDWIELGTQDGSPGDNFSPFGLDDVNGNDIFIGGGGFDEMIGEGGDDIFVGSDAQDKMDGMSGFDWVTYQKDKIGITVDLELAALNEPPVAASPASILDRFAEVEGVSGSKFTDYIRGSNADAIEIATFNAKTSALDAAGIARINGLQALLDNALTPALGTHVTGFGTGNIILGGDGSDVILGLGGDDVIDGDAAMHVRVSLRANADGTGPEIGSFDSLAPLISKMLDGTYNPGQLVAVREIVGGTANAAGRADNFDTAVFQGNRGDYTVTVVDNGTPTNFADDVVTVTDNVAGRDGTDHLTHIERLQFADVAIDVVPNLDAAPVGALAITDENAGALNVGDVLSVSIAGVTDADNPGGAITGPIRYTWQAEFIPNSGVFDDIVVLPGGDLAFESASGTRFRVTPDLAGLSLRVKALYVDAHGVAEQVFSAPTTAVGPAPVVAPVTVAPVSIAAEGGPGIHLVRSDLDFILDQIRISEAHAAGTPLTDLIPNIRLAYGLRTVDGSENNLSGLVGGPDQNNFGKADTVFPRLLDPNFHAAEAGTSYAQTSGTVIDSQPRTISNLIVDQTANNPAAYAAAVDPGADGVLNFGIPIGTLGNDDVLKDGVQIVKSPGLDGTFGTADDRDVFYFPNVTPDAGLGAPFNAWFTFFGQFFDHGLDLVTKGGNGTIFVPLKADDPLVAGTDGLFGTADDLPPALRFMVETRATMRPGPDGILGTADDIHEQENTTTPFVDQNQTYTSHPSHQVFLRAYQMVDTDPGAGVHLAPVATGKLITNRDLGADGKFGTADDHEIGGMSTWKVVKAQARDLLGINLTDKDFDNVPLLATDQYGNFIKGPNGFPQVVMKGADGLGGTADDVLVEGNPLAPIDLTNAVRTGHQFLIDVAHNAVPVIDALGNLVADADHVAGNAVAFNPATGQNLEYDDELLDAHYIAGDGRVNENIGLTTVHSIFHSEHNRLVDQTKDTVRAALAAGDVNFAAEWVMGATPAERLAAVADGIIQDNEWNGERLFQVAKFGTEMQYQHLVFEEFARTVQPMIDPFFAPTQVYDVDLNPSIVAEFAHTVYRFGHSMLTETVDRFNADFSVVSDPNTPDPDDQLGLIAAFLNPLAFAASGATPIDAASAIVRGVTRTVGNEIDEFVTEALRNNLLGTPLDLAVLNLARGRDTGIPTLQAARRDFYTQTGDTWEKPYTSWADLVQHLKHPESLVNFIAAYGTHQAITSETTMAGKRAAALLLVVGDGNDADGVTINGVTYTDRLDFLNATGAWADISATHPKDLDGVSNTGLGNIDFWIGGLAEAQMPFGGLLGSTFNFVFENQLEKLQDADRFYYLERTSGLSFGNELESNSFAKLIMANTNAVHLPALVFSTPAFTLEVDQSKQFTGLGALGRDDPTGGVTINGVEITPLVIRDNPDTVGPDSNFLHYTGEDHVVLGGTSGNDIIISSIGDDTLWGDEGNDRLDGGYGDDNIRGGAGDDIITDSGGVDNIQGGDGNDVIQGGGGGDLILGGFGKDFISTGEDNSEAFGGAGDDFILGNKSNEQDIGNEGDDWIEKGTSDGAPGDNFDPLGNDPIPGNDIFIGDGENDKFIGEGGDDIMVGSKGLTDRFFGASGFDWATYKNDDIGVTIDFSGRFFDQPPVPGSGASDLTRFDIMEGLSGSAHDDWLAGDDAVDLVGGEVGRGVNGSALTNIALINGLQEFLDTAFGAELSGTVPLPTGIFANTTLDHITAFTTGNIILGGAGSDIMMGRGGDDIIDGDAWLNVRISVHQNADGTGPEIATFDSMQDMVPLMLNGTYNAGQLVAVREILQASGPDFDTAKFLGPLDNYTFLVDGIATDAADLAGVGLGHVVTVVDGVGDDGTDRVMNVERLQFSDQSIVLGGLNNEPVGSLQLIDVATNTQIDPTNAVVLEGQKLRVSIAGVTDADNPGDHTIPAPVAYFWQVEDRPGSGVFSDITTFAALEIAREHGPTFTPTNDQSGLLIRVRAVYQDAHGVLEEVFSAPQLITDVNVAATGTPVISDTTPTEDIAITASTAGIADADGLTDPVFSFQWQRLVPATATWTDIPVTLTNGANTAVFTPGATEVGLQLRVVVTFTDDKGNLETLTSAATGPTGDHIVGTAAANTLTGTPFDDWIQGLGNNDILNGGLGGDLLEGGAGNDTLNGDAGNDVLIGGAGTDAINGGAGNDIISYVVGDGADNINGGADTDTLSIAGTIGSDTLNVIFNGALTGVGGGAATLANVEAVNADLGVGIDTLVYAAGSGAVTVNLTTHSASGFTSISGIENVTGGNGNDTLTGDALGNALNGGGGNDLLNGGADGDTLTGGTGTDTVSYAAQAGGMVVNLATGIAHSAVTGGEDMLITIENATGGAGNDTMTGSSAGGAAGNNLLDGGAGNDIVDGGAGNDTLLGGSGTDSLTGGSGLDSIDGGLGNDTITGGVGNDSLFGGDGDDIFNYLVGVDGIDSVNGGDGLHDLLNITGSAGANTLRVTYNGTSITAITGEISQLANVEHVHADLLGGTDLLDYGATNVGVTVNLQAGTASGFSAISGAAIAGIDNVIGGSGADSLTGDINANQLSGGGGDDVLNGGLGNDALIGGGGTDTASYAGETANMFIDLAAGQARRGSVASPVEDTFTSIENATGGSGNDSITGSGGANTLNGGAGADNISGGGGADVLIGGLGDDVMNGNAGNDAFVFDAGFGHDTIVQFGDTGGNQDVLDFSTTVFANFAAVQAASHQVGTDVHIDVDAAHGVVLLNVALANLGADDFRFH